MQRGLDVKDIVDIANAKTKELQDKYDIAIKGIKDVHLQGSYTDVAAKIARQVLRECGE